MQLTKRKTHVPLGFLAMGGKAFRLTGRSVSRLIEKRFIEKGLLRSSQLSLETSLLFLGSLLTWLQFGCRFGLLANHHRQFQQFAPSCKRQHHFWLFRELCQYSLKRGPVNTKPIDGDQLVVDIHPDS